MDFGSTLSAVKCNAVPRSRVVARGLAPFSNKNCKVSNY